MRGMYSQPFHSYVPTSPKLNHRFSYSVPSTGTSSPPLSPVRSNKRCSGNVSPPTCSIPFIIISPPPLPPPTADEMEIEPRYCGKVLEPYKPFFIVIDDHNSPSRKRSTRVDLPYIAPMTRTTRPTSFSRIAVTSTRCGYTPPAHWAKAKVVF